VLTIHVDIEKILIARAAVGDSFDAMVGYTFFLSACCTDFANASHVSAARSPAAKLIIYIYSNNL